MEDGERKVTKKLQKKFPNKHPIILMFIVSIVSNLLVIGLVGFFAIAHKLNVVVEEIPTRMTSIDSSLKILNTSIQYVQSTENKGGFKPLKVGFIFNKDFKSVLPKDQAVVGKSVV